jgi:hypothetical protein
MIAPKLTGNRCQCAACGECFNSTSTFDRHRAGDFSTPTSRRCRTPAELILRGWSRNARGFWIERAMRREASTARAGSTRNAEPMETYP